MSVAVKGEGWLILDANGNPIGIDNASGGYPYAASDATDAKWFASEAEAEQYKKTAESAGGVYCPAPWGVVHAVVTIDDDITSLRSGNSSAGLTSSLTEEERRHIENVRGYERGTTPTAHAMWAAVGPLVAALDRLTGGRHG